MATFGGQETCGRVAIVNGKTEQTPRATTSLGQGIVGGGQGGGAGGRADFGWAGAVGRGGPGRVRGEGGVAGEHRKMRSNVCNVSE